MSQRNPMNERYTTEKHQGVTRKSAASAKPKKAQAGTVMKTSAKKSPKERKAEEKQRRKEESARQREIDRKYYKPDTERYKQLRRIWVILLVGAVLSVVLSWVLRSIQPEWIAIVFLILAYVFIIAAFYVDFSKIRRERRAYQTRMIALEVEQEKAERAARSQQSKNKNKNKGNNKGNNKKQTKDNEEDNDNEDDQE